VTGGGSTHMWNSFCAIGTRGCRAQLVSRSLSGVVAAQRQHGRGMSTRVRIATAADAAAVTELVNTAFYEGDRFFKV